MHIAMGVCKNVRKGKQIKKKPLTWRKVSLHRENAPPRIFNFRGGASILAPPPMHIA